MFHYHKKFGHTNMTAPTFPLIKYKEEKSVFVY